MMKSRDITLLKQQPMSANIGKTAVMKKVKKVVAVATINILD
jgi:hypothetical protein